MSTLLRDHLKAAALVRMKQRSRKAWAERHDKCDCPICTLRRSQGGGGVRIVSLSDLLGRDDDTADTPEPAKHLN